MTPGLDAARTGDWARCLEELLAAWRTHRTIELADAIERAGKLAASKDIRPTSAAIRKRIATLTAVDVTPLVETIERQARVSPTMLGIAIELAQKSLPDPRIARLLRWFTGEDDLHPGLIDMLAAHDDPRSRTLLEQRAKYWGERRARFHRRRARIDHLIATASQDWPIYSTPDDDVTPLVPLLEAKPEQDLTHLLDAVYADLTNDAPRMIYADALQDAGDPRGEMITLQLTNPGTRRELQLIRDHERVWLGPLDKVVQKSGLVWSRGFVSALRLVGRTLDAPMVAEHAWLTVEQLDLAECWGENIARWLVTLPVLRRVYRMLGRDTRFLPPEVPWTHVGLRSSTGVELPAMPNLEELDLSNFWSNGEVRAFYNSLKTPPPRVRISIPTQLPQPFVPANTTVVIVPSFEFPPLAKLPEIWLRGREVELHKVDRTLAYPTAILGRLRDRIDRITVITKKALNLAPLQAIAPAVIA